MKLLRVIACSAYWLPLAPLVLLSQHTHAADWPQLAQALTPLVEKAAADGVRMSIGVFDLSAAAIDAKQVLLGSPGSYPPASTVKMLLVAALIEPVDAGAQRHRLDRGR